MQLKVGFVETFFKSAIGYNFKLKSTKFKEIHMVPIIIKSRKLKNWGAPSETAHIDGMIIDCTKNQ